MSTSETPTVSVFLSSSSDVIAERRIVTGLVAELAQRHQRYVDIQVVDWQADFYSVDTDFQGQIPNAADSDLVVCIFHRRVGSELDPAKYTRPDGSRYEGGAVYEFECAFERRTREGSPDLYVFRKSADVVYTEGPNLDEQRRQYQMLQQFLGRWFEDGEGHLTSGWNSFEDAEDFRKQFKEFFSRWFDDWAEAHDIKLLDWDSHPQADGSPFVGLAPFTERHCRVFFGRESEMHRAVELLSQSASREEGVASLLILGASGAGKSSFMHAALLPQLLTPGLTEGVDRWLRAELRLDPQEPQPLLRLTEQLFAARMANENESTCSDTTGPLASALAKSVFSSPHKLAEQLRDRPEHAGELLGKAISDVGNSIASGIPGLDVVRVRLLLSVDQLEALVGQGAGESAGACLQVLESLARSGSVWLVAAARNDHYAQLQRAEPLRRLLAEGTRLDLLHPDPSQLREMVEGPVRAAGLQYEKTADDDLGEQLIADVGGTDALPLLQVALSEIFDRLQQRRTAQGFDTARDLLLADYQALSQDETMPGLLGAIDRHAESCWQQHLQLSGGSSSDADLQALIRRLAMPGTEDKETASQPIVRDSFTTTPERISLVDTFVASRLLVTYERDGKTWLRPSHDALLRHWRRANSHIATDRDHLHWRESMRLLGSRWQHASSVDKPQHLRLPPAALAGALSLREVFGNELQQEGLIGEGSYDGQSLGDFLDAVYKHSQKVKRRKAITIGGVIGILVIALVGISFLTFTAIEHLRTSVERFSEAMVFASKSELKNGNPRTATLLGLKAYGEYTKNQFFKPTRSLELENQIRSSVFMESEQFHYKVEDAFASFVSKNYSRLAVVRAGRRNMVVFNRLDSVPISEIVFPNNIDQVQLSHNGELIASTDFLGTLYIHDTSTGNLLKKEKLREAPEPRGYFSESIVAWNHSGLLAVSFENQLQIFDTLKGYAEKFDSTAPDRIYALDWQPNGSQLLVKFRAKPPRIISPLMGGNAKTLKFELKEQGRLVDAGWIDDEHLFVTTKKGKLIYWKNRWKLEKPEIIDVSEFLEASYDGSFAFRIGSSPKLGSLYLYQNPGSVFELKLENSKMDYLGSTPRLPWRDEGTFVRSSSRVGALFGLLISDRLTFLRTYEGQVTESSLFPQRTNRVSTSKSSSIKNIWLSDTKLAQIVSSGTKSGDSYLNVFEVNGLIADSVLSKSVKVSRFADNMRVLQQYLFSNPKNKENVYTFFENEVVLHDVQGESRVFHQFSDSISAIAWSHDGRHLMVALEGGALVDLRESGVIKECAGSKNTVTKIEWAANGDWFATQDVSGEVKKWIARECEVVFSKKMSVFGNRTMTLNSDSTKIAVAGLNAGIAIIDSKTFQIIRSLNCNSARPASSFSSLSWDFTNSDRIVATSGGASYCGGDNIHVWNASTGDNLASYAYPGNTTEAIFSHDGEKIAFTVTDSLANKATFLISSPMDFDSVLSVAKSKERRKCFNNVEAKRYGIDLKYKCLMY